MASLKPLHSVIITTAHEIGRDDFSACECFSISGITFFFEIGIGKTRFVGKRTERTLIPYVMEHLIHFIVSYVTIWSWHYTLSLAKNPSHKAPRVVLPTMSRGPHHKSWWLLWKLRQCPCKSGLPYSYSLCLSNFVGPSLVYKLPLGFSLVLLVFRVVTLSPS